ncbi:hypothetical protein ACFLYO_00425 [Chloroflexota bacterium]
MNGWGGENEYLIAGNGAIYPLADLGITVTGLGELPVEYVTSTGHRQHGYTVEDWTLSGRTLSLQFTPVVRGRSAFWAKRQVLINALSPVDGAVTYRRVLPGGERRDIQGWAKGLAMPPGADGLHFPVSFSLECPDPSWLDPAVRTLNIQHSNVELTYPITYPITFGIDGIGSGIALNNGNWRSYPIIAVVGPFEWVALSNETTGAMFSIQAQHQVGQTTVIDLAPGRQTITRDGENLFNMLGAGSNLVDWYLRPGENFISVSSREDTDDSSVALTYYDRYIAL